MKDATRSQPQLWAPKVTRVIFALTQSRRALRQAARRSGDRRLAQRLRRLARRKRAAVAELRRDTPPADPKPDDIEPAAAIAGEIAHATAIGSTAACLRTNRKLRAAIDEALAASPPAQLHARLERLREQTDRESAVLHSDLRGHIAQTVPPENATHEPL